MSNLCDLLYFNTNSKKRENSQSPIQQIFFVWPPEWQQNISLAAIIVTETDPPRHIHDAAPSVLDRDIRIVADDQLMAM